MKAKVIKRFRDKYTNAIHAVDSFFEGDENRVAELQKLGYLEGSEPKEKSLLDGNAQEVIASITAKYSKEELEALLAEEKEGKKRKTVIEHIESLLA